MVLCACLLLWPLVRARPNRQALRVAEGISIGGSLCGDGAWRGEPLMLPRLADAVPFSQVKNDKARQALELYCWGGERVAAVFDGMADAVKKQLTKR